MKIIFNFSQVFIFMVMLVSMNINIDVCDNYIVGNDSTKRENKFLIVKYHK